MARSPFSLIRAICAYRAEACFAAAFAFMLLHDPVGHRRVVVHTTTAGIVRHEISRHEHGVERRFPREVVRMRQAERMRPAGAQRTVHLTPRRTVERVRTVEPVQQIRTAPLPRSEVFVEPARPDRAGARSPAVVSIESAPDVRASVGSGGNAAASGTRVREEFVRVLVPGSVSITF